MTSDSSERRRATGKDWAKAFTCSLLLLLLLLFLFRSPFSGSGGGRGSGFGTAGAGPGGGGEGSGIGVGDGSGIGPDGDGSGAESGGDRGGGDTDSSTTGGDAPADSASPFGAAGEGGASRSDPSDEASPEEAATSPVAGSSDIPESDTPSDTTAANASEVGESGNMTLAIIQPDAAPAPPEQSGNRFVGGRGTSGVSGGNSPGGNVGGMQIRSGRLGVILDVSGSMSPYLEELRRDIQRNFSDAHFLEVNGCSLLESDFDPGEFLSREPPTDPMRRNVTEAMMELVLVYRVDAVYWFSDLEDRRTINGLDQIRDLVWGKDMPPLKRVDSWDPVRSQQKQSPLDSMKKPENPNAVFRLYIRSAGQFPDNVLQQIVDESGGQFQLKR